MVTKLEKLLVGEVSGVDRPANMLDGWMVAKASTLGPGADTWDVDAAERRIRASTGATDTPNKDYASCFLWHDGEAEDHDGDGVPDGFGDYKFLVCDVVDGEVLIMPSAIRAAASRLADSSLSDTDKRSVGAVIAQLEVKAGIGDGAVKTAAGDAPSIANRVISLFRKTEEEIDMTSEELNAALDERVETLKAHLSEIVKSASPAPDGAGTAEGDGGEEPAAPAPAEAPAPADGGEETPAEGEEPPAPASGLTTEEVQKEIGDAVSAALKPYNEILEKVLDRLESAERALGIAARKSIDGQEGGGGANEEATPTLKDAIGAAFRAPVALR